ncbi:hypothetical protein N657DRAFT_711518 [Parathielavia appendiculata]|uniref:Uncharacterized protein n=1 Tax=Parathielavia appendiculata TaxID=2587402 RepID=A0AAN6TQQ2_9PEZI|nr:hypothetical protein N657DRAFT_711518 [Parathielavia appendiculata]
MPAAAAWVLVGAHDWQGIVLEHLEEWKALYGNPATELASQQPSEPFSQGPSLDSMPRLSTPSTSAKDRPALQSRLSQHLQGFEVATPLRKQQQLRHRQPDTATATTTQFNKAPCLIIFARCAQPSQ